MLKLKINGQNANFGSEKDLDVKLYRQFLDLQNLSERSGDKSYTIKIPKNKENNIIFESANCIDTIDKFVRQEEYPVELETDGNNNIIGIFKLTQITDENYEGIFLSNNIAWARKIDGKNLNELTNQDGSAWEFPFIGSSANTAQYSFQWYVENATYANSDVCFPFIARGHFWHSANTQVNRIHDDSCTFSDFPPGVYKMKIAKKIFENIFMSLDGDLLGDSEHQKLFLPFTSGDYYKWNTNLLYGASSSASTIDHDYPQTNHNYFSKSYTDGTNNLTTVNFNPSTIIANPLNRIRDYSFTDLNNASLTAKEYYVAAPGKLNMDLHFKFKAAGLLGTSTIMPPTAPQRTPNLTRGGFILYIHTDAVTDQDIFDDVNSYLWSTSPSAAISNPNVIFYYDVYQSSTYHTPTSFQPFDNTANISVVDTTGNNFLLNAFVYMLYITGGTIDVSIRDVNVFNTMDIRCAWVGYANPQFSQVLRLDEYSWTFSGSTGGSNSINVNIAENLGDMSQLEFLRSWLVENNLFISYNKETNTVRFDTYDNFFLDNTFAYDISDKVDLNNNEPTTLPMGLPRNIYYEYQNDSEDGLVSQDMNYGNLQVSSTNIYTSNDQTLQAVYSSTRLRDYVYMESGVTFDIPCICKKEDLENSDLTTVQWNFNSSYRILKTDTFLTASGQTCYINVDGYPTKILLSLFEDTRDPTKLSLKFDGENGLYERYYQRQYNELERSHKIEVNSKINTFDFNNMEPNVPVKIRNQHYILNNIDGFSPTNASYTKLQLFKKFTN